MNQRQSEPALIERLLVNRERFLNFLAPRVESREAAEEILQAAFAKSVERSGDVRHEEKVVAWFFRLLRNALIDHYRRREAKANALERWAALPGPEPSAVDSELEQSVCTCILDLLPTLKPAYADVIGRVDLDGVAVGVFSREHGITPNNAAVRLHRARQALRKRLEAMCGACAVHSCLDCDCRQRTTR